MARKPVHKWAFKPGMRASAFGWRGSAKATQRLKSASAEIRVVNRADPVTAADGVVALAARIWPAFEHIDTSSGALGTAVRRTRETRRQAKNVLFPSINGCHDPHRGHSGLGGKSPLAFERQVTRTRT